MIVDIIIVAVTALCFALGILTGFVIQAAGIVAIIAGITAAVFLGATVTEAISPRWIENPAVASMCASLLLFSTASVTVRLLAVLFSKLLEKMRLQRLDKLLGGVVGAIKGFVICAIIVCILTRQEGRARQAMEGSMLGESVVAIADYVLGKPEDKEGLLQKLKQTGSKFTEGIKSLGNNGREFISDPKEDTPPVNQP